MAKKFMTNAEIMKKAEAEIAGTLFQIRRDTSRTDAYKRQEIARAYKHMQAIRDQLIAERDNAKKDYQRQLERSIFGAGDPLSRRDAGDRAALLEDPSAALYALKRAERAGDEPMSRAIAERAYEMGWSDVADQFLETRPDLDGPFNELWAQAQPNMTQVIHDGFVLQARPEELGTLQDYEIDHLAAAPLSPSEAMA